MKLLVFRMSQPSQACHLRVRNFPGVRPIRDLTGRGGVLPPQACEIKRESMPVSSSSPTANWGVLSGKCQQDLLSPIRSH